MSKIPLIAGRFTYDPATKQLHLVFNGSGRSTVIYDADFEKQARGEVQIQHTGGRACKDDERTWAQQLSETLNEEATAVRKVITPEPAVRRYDTKGRIKLSVKDLDLVPLLADIVKKEEAA